ncbi:MAG: cell division protein ZipA [Thiohalobacteraceae bacterium]
MDLIRWILLIIGALIVAAVYWWSRRSVREQERMFVRTEPGVAHRDEDFDPLFAPPRHQSSRARGSDDEADLDAVHRELSSLQELLQAEAADRAGQPTMASIELREPVEPEPDFVSEPIMVEPRAPKDAAPDPSRTTPPPTSPPEEKLVVLYLVAPANQVFPGDAVGAALEGAGLQYGEMHIYHRYADGDAGGAPVFGAANLVEPGTLEIEALAATGTPGLTLFLQLPGPLRPLEAFDLFAGCAQQIAAQLGGELRDQSRNALSRQTLEHLRDDVEQYELRLRLQRHA